VRILAHDTIDQRMFDMQKEKRDRVAKILGDKAKDLETKMPTLEEMRVLLGGKPNTAEETGEPSNDIAPQITHPGELVEDGGVDLADLDDAFYALAPDQQDKCRSDNGELARLLPHDEFGGLGAPTGVSNITPEAEDTEWNSVYNSLESGSGHGGGVRRATQIERDDDHSFVMDHDKNDDANMDDGVSAVDSMFVSGEDDGD
jgi:hypothetical protein